MGIVVSIYKVRARTESEDQDSPGAREIYQLRFED